MEERFRPLTFHGLILRSQLVTLLIRGVCYAENESVRRAHTHALLALEVLVHARVSMFALCVPECRSAQTVVRRDDRRLSPLPRHPRAGPDAAQPPHDSSTTPTPSPGKQVQPSDPVCLLRMSPPT